VTDDLAGTTGTLEALHRKIAELEQTVEELRGERSRAVESERALKAFEALHQRLLDESPDLLLLLDRAGRVRLANRQLSSLFGMSPEGILGVAVEALGDAPWLRALADHWRRESLESDRTSSRFVVGGDGAAGRQRHIHSLLCRFSGDDGQPLTLVVARDVTELREAELQAAATERRLEYVLQATGEGVWDWNVQTGALAHNDRWFELLGFSPEELTHTVDDFLRCLVDEERPRVQEKIRACFEEQTPYASLHRMRRADGRLIWVYDRGNVVERDAAGRPLRMVGSFADVTSRKLAEDHIEEVNANLERLVADRTHELTAANLALQETLARLQATQQQLIEREKLAALGGVVAGVAHEINTPVGVAVTAISLLEERQHALKAALQGGTLKRSQLDDTLASCAELMGVVSTNLDRAGRLIRDFKQVAVSQSVDELEEFSLREAVEGAVTSLSPEWMRSPVRVVVEGDAALRMRAAPGFVFQVVSNLVVNALRHAFPDGRSGTVRFIVERTQSGARLAYVDDGVGAGAEVLARMFEPFFTTRRSDGGSGLGLNIVWNLITGQLGGQLEATSAPGQGMRILMMFPCLPEVLVDSNGARQR
jgi:PAS domain S-box-containing protein